MPVDLCAGVRADIRDLALNFDRLGFGHGLRLDHTVLRQSEPLNKEGRIFESFRPEPKISLLVLAREVFPQYRTVDMDGVIIGHNAWAVSITRLCSGHGLPGSRSARLTLVLLSSFLLCHQNGRFVPDSDHVIGHQCRKDIFQCHGSGFADILESHGLTGRIEVAKDR